MVWRPDIRPKGQGDPDPGRTYNEQKKLTDQEERLRQMTALMEGQGAAVPQGILEEISRNKDWTRRFGANAAEFYSHPGSFQALQQTLGMFGQQAPDVYGAPWESAMRQRIGSMAGSEQQMMQQQAEQGLAQRGLFGALGQSAQTQIGQAGAQSRMQAMMGLRTLLDDKRMELFEDQFARDYQATGLLQSLISGQPAYPIVQKQKMSGLQTAMGFMGALGGLAGGIGGLAAGFGGGGAAKG